MNDDLARATSEKDCIAIFAFADGTNATLKKFLIVLSKPVVGMISVARHMAVPAETAWGIEAHDMRGLVATGASNVPIDRLGIDRFGAR